MKQFDRNEGLCAKINELFNGAFWSNFYAFNRSPKQTLVLRINQWIFQILLLALFNNFYLRINAFPFAPRNGWKKTKRRLQEKIRFHLLCLWFANGTRSAVKHSPRNPFLTPLRWTRALRGCRIESKTFRFRRWKGAKNAKEAHFQLNI